MGVGAYSRPGTYQRFLPLGWALFEVGAKSRLGTDSNKYGSQLQDCLNEVLVPEWMVSKNRIREI